jgi:hypothetical protein
VHAVIQLQALAVLEPAFAAALRFSFVRFFKVNVHFCTPPSNSALLRTLVGDFGTQQIFRKD